MISATPPWQGRRRRLRENLTLLTRSVPPQARPAAERRPMLDRLFLPMASSLGLALQNGLGNAEAVAVPHDRVRLVKSSSGFYLAE